MTPPLRIVVSIDRQRMTLLRGDTPVRSFPVSTASRGTGSDPGSYRTPTGRFAICKMIGDGQPPGTIFVGRRPAGRWSPGDTTGGDLILTRILWLDGLDPDNANTRQRYIYIHGTNQEHLLGTPASMGCIRMAGPDIIELFSRVTIGTEVGIPGPGNDDPGLTSVAARATDQDISHRKGRKNRRSLHVTSAPGSTYTARVMSNAKKGKRYSPEEKMKVIAFVEEVNKKNKRGGQKAASEKFGISPLTIASWLKAGKKAKPAAAKKTAKKTAKRGRPAKKTAKRGRPAKKTAKRGRPAKKTAKRGRPAKKTAKRGRPAKKAAKRGRPAGGSFSTKLRKLATLHDQIADTKSALVKMEADYAKLKKAL